MQTDVLYTPPFTVHTLSPQPDTLSLLLDTEEGSSIRKALLSECTRRTQVVHTDVIHEQLLHFLGLVVILPSYFSANRCWSENEKQI